MDRRKLLSCMGIGAATAIIAPNILAGSSIVSNFSQESWRGFPDERAYLEYIGWNPEQITAWMRMRKFEQHVGDIYHSVAQEFPQEVPNVGDDKKWRHGDYRIRGRLGWYSVDSSTYPSVPYFAKLSDISCFCFLETSRSQ